MTVAEFTVQDFAARMDSAVEQAVTAGLTGVLIIGLTTHEPPYMVEGEEHLLEPGMCFSIEPASTCPGASACGSGTSSSSP